MDPAGSVSTGSGPISTAAPTSAARGQAGVVRHAARRRNRRHAVLISALGLVLFLTSGVAWAYRDLSTNIEAHDVEDLLGTDRPEAPEPDPLDGAVDQAEGQPINLVLIGSDDRSGDNRAIGGGTTPGIRSDTVIVAHISADRERVEMISIPRDSWVTIPECQLPDGSMSQPQEGKFNGAFEIGGVDGDVGYAAACTMRTIESLTGVRLDGFVSVDFNGFVDVVDALGGVPICIPEDIDDRDAKLQLEAGDQVLDGTDALGYARVRKTVGDGSDTQRIGRQQDLLAATLRHALDQNLLTDGRALYSFLDAATSSVTASSNYASISSLAGLALSLRGLDPADITFATVPFVDRGDGANVLWSWEAEELWEAVAADQALTLADEEDEAGDGEAGTEDDGADTDEASPTDDPTGPTVDGATAEDDDLTCG